MSTYYTVQPGDTLGKIADKYYGTPSKYMEIADANHLANPNDIQVGMKLLIPNVNGNLSQENHTNSSGSLSLTIAQYKAIIPYATEANLEKYAEPLNINMASHEINTPLRVANFIAQIAHESGSLNYNTENLNYSAQALQAVFGKYFPTAEMANEYARKPEQIANIVYANRMGNGDTASGDGWKYRGRGLIQLTGKYNYQECGNGLNLDLVDHPDQLANNPNTAVLGAIWYWNSRNLNMYADQDNIRTITQLINGGYNGLADREAFLARAKQVLGI